MNREDPKVLESAAKLSKSQTEANEEAFLLECVSSQHLHTNLNTLHCIVATLRHLLKLLPCA